MSMFKTKKIKTQTLGDELKQAREAAGITVKQFSKQTRIPVNYLRHLEQGDYDQLPADVYVTAYLQNYAQALNLNTDKILNQFKVERGLTSNWDKREQENRKKSTSFINKKPLIVTPKKVALVISIIAIALIFGYFWHQLSYLIYPPSIKITYPTSDVTINKEDILISGKTRPDTHLTINGREVSVDEKGEFSSLISLDMGLNIVRIEVKDRFGKTNAVVRKIMVTK